MLPVALSLIGTHSRPATIAFIGWFGPRGLASIVFAAIVVGESHVPVAATIGLTAYVTIALSTFAHGLSAAPLVGRYAGWLARNRASLRGVEVASATDVRPKGPAALARAS
jgi:NhaP-type Na+/H+ or K+/H+ antiporter